jgi:hypothetical protein
VSVDQHLLAIAAAAADGGNNDHNTDCEGRNDPAHADCGRERDG